MSHRCASGLHVSCVARFSLSHLPAAAPSRARTSTSPRSPAATRSSSRSTTARTSRWSARRATVTFKKGANPLQFSWANTLIDPTSVELKFLTNADKLDVLDTTFPHDKPQMLYWNVQSEIDGEATIEITYFTSGITWSADYLCIADKDEKQMSFEGFVRVFNNSGEEYENAQVRLVVGTINLVEKIAQLAQHSDRRRRATWLRDRNRTSYRDKAARTTLSPKDDGLRRAGRQAAPAKPKADHQGRAERVLHLHDRRDRDDPQRLVASGCGRSKGSRRAVQDSSTAIGPQEYGDQLVRMYLLTNDEESKLGTTPLPDGIVRVFRDNGRDGLSYLTQQTDQVHPDRRQDRAEPRARSGSHLRADQAARLPRQPLAADQRHRARSARSAATA